LRKPAVLALEDGSLFRGESIGADGQAQGEVVFNTSITGYQEIITDPSYCQQIVTLTYPHVGNVGTNQCDQEAASIYASGLVVRDCPHAPSNWRNQKSLEDYLHEQGMTAIAGVDTRRLTRLLREKGALNGCLMAGDQLDTELALQLARAFPGLKGMDLVRVVSVSHPYLWCEGTWDLASNGFQIPKKQPYHVVAYDYGVKYNILRMLVDRGCWLTIVPAHMSAREVQQLNPNGVFLSNGPGDPEPCDYAVVAIRELLAEGIPIFGICLGHQLLGLASGARIIKMKFGHHGSNHPVLDLESGRVMISSQNHGFAVDETILPTNLRPTHRSLFDGSLQGMARTDRPAFSFQGHPEASPGSHDLAPLLDRFIAAIKAHAIRF
jgi:carbamoyl-phosphate synthase small subunit